MQIIEQTHDENVAMYMKSCTKLELAKMLTSCNEIFTNDPVKVSFSAAAPRYAAEK